MSQLTAKNLCLGYDGTAVSENINFHVNKGDYLCIVGENGSGKSTLVKTLAGLAKPLGGSITRGDGLTLSRIGYLPQQTSMQKDFPASAWEIVLSGCLASSGRCPFYTTAQKSQAAANMERLGIAGLKNSSYRNLSGGQQQRVLLARALCAAEEMLLLDEPAAALDPAASEEMYSIIRQLNETDKITIIMVSHDIETALKYASHILHMGPDLQFFGTKEDYLKSPLKNTFRLAGTLAGNLASALPDLKKYTDDDLCSRATAQGRKRRYFK